MTVDLERAGGSLERVHCLGFQWMPCGRLVMHARNMVHNDSSYGSPENRSADVSIGERKNNLMTSLGRLEDPTSEGG